MSKQTRRPEDDRREPQPDTLDKTPAEDQEQAVDLPDREAMSLIKPSLFPLDLGGTLGLPDSGTPDPQVPPDTAPVPEPHTLDRLA